MVIITGSLWHVGYLTRSSRLSLQPPWLEQSLLYQLTIGILTPVLLKRLGPEEAAATLAAFVRVVLPVGSLMFFQVWASPELLATDGAGIGLDPAVDDDVSLQLVWLAEGWLFEKISAYGKKINQGR